MTRIYNHLKVIVLVAVLTALPVHILFDHFSTNGGFLGLIYFGQEFKASALPEIKEIAPAITSRWGYDGQFYAQMALRPALTDPALARALDNPAYRARRIGLPGLAFCLGIGKAAWVLQIYALLNFCFWLVLLVALLRFVGFHRARDLLLAASLLWSTGTLASVARSLTDFPATVVGFLAVVSSRNWIIAAMLLGVSGMIKETSILSFAAIPWGKNPHVPDVKRLLISALIVFSPIALWLMYVHYSLGSGLAAGNNNFTFPFCGIAQKFCSALQGLVTGIAGASPAKQASLCFEVLCPASLVVQAAYLVAKPRLRSEAWRFGIGFVILLSVLGGGVWVEQFAYCRVLLPLTFSFNLLIHEHEFGHRLVTWFLLGNLGMCWLAPCLFL